MDVRMFSNLAQMAAGYLPEECGMNGVCSCYFVVEVGNCETGLGYETK